jgi:hypothetical protein
MRIWIWSLALSAAIAACTSDRERSASQSGRTPTVEAESVEAPKPRRPLRTFDVEGRLIPSNEYVGGIPLPRGVELFRADEVTHVYRIRAPIDKVLAYIGPMMITGNVERRGKGAVYKRASVRGAEVNPTKVDVSITEIGSNLVRIAVTELPPPPAHVPSTVQTKAAARDTWRTLD